MDSPARIRSAGPQRGEPALERRIAEQRLEQRQARWRPYFTAPP